MFKRFFPAVLLIALPFLMLFLIPVSPAFAAPDSASVSASAQTDRQHSAEAVMQQFAGDDEIAPERRIETKRKHQILFMMGLSLLVLVLLTGGLGVAMVAFGKDVFVPHMICAGLSMSLAVAHAVTASVWFWPY